MSEETPGVHSEGTDGAGAPGAPTPSIEARIAELTTRVAGALEENERFRSTMTLALGRIGSNELDLKARVAELERALGATGAAPVAADPEPTEHRAEPPGAAPGAGAPDPELLARLDRVERRQGEVDAHLQALGEQLRRFDEQAARMVEYLTGLADDLRRRFDDAVAAGRLPASDGTPAAGSARPRIELPSLVPPARRERPAVTPPAPGPGAG